MKWKTADSARLLVEIQLLHLSMTYGSMLGRGSSMAFTELKQIKEQLAYN